MKNDKGIYRAEDETFGGHYGVWKTFRKWLNYFLTRHGFKPKDLFVYKDPETKQQYVLECINVVEALLSTSPSMHLQIKMMLETREAQGIRMKDFFAQMGGQLIQAGYFDRDPRFKKVDLKVDAGPLN